ncbi:MAG: putative rane protein [Anaerocolumna sp.]|nr:putative rane protein [Anaerocolumna sp.]
MKRFIVVTLEILICFLLQTTVFQWIPLAGVVPNLLLIIAVSTGLMRGRTEGLMVGFFCGLLIDLNYGTVVGLYALFYLLIGYLSGYTYKIFVRDDITIPLILIGVSDLVYFFLHYVFVYLLKGKLNIGFYFLRMGLPEVIYTVIISIFLYKIFNIINSKLEKKEEEEAA